MAKGKRRKWTRRARRWVRLVAAGLGGILLIVATAYMRLPPLPTLPEPPPDTASAWYTARVWITGHDVAIVIIGTLVLALAATLWELAEMRPGRLLRGLDKWLAESDKLMDEMRGLRMVGSDAGLPERYKREYAWPEAVTRWEWACGEWLKDEAEGTGYLSLFRADDADEKLDKATVFERLVNRFEHCDAMLTHRRSKLFEIQKMLVAQHG